MRVSLVRVLIVVIKIFYSFDEYVNLYIILRLW